ncbi:hypothetical protein ABQE48_14740, partial [Mycolicibacterium thermoresistibile]
MRLSGRRKKISEIVADANEYIDVVQKSDTENKEDLTKSAIELARGANIAAIAMHAGFVSGELAILDLARSPSFAALVEEAGLPSLDSFSDGETMANGLRVDPVSNKSVP